MTGVTASPTNLTVTALNNVTLTCIPSFGATPDGYSWHRVNGDIPSQSSGQNTDTLTFHRVVPADEGEYYCMATQFVRHCAVSNNVMVTVESKTIILHKHYEQLCIVKLVILNKQIFMYLKSLLCTKFLDSVH